MIKGLILDLDGCLIDSTKVQKKAFFDSYKIVVGDDNCPSYEEYIKHTGDSIDNVIAKMGLPCEMAYYYRKISSESIEDISVNWSFVDYIKTLRQKGIKFAICTGKDRDRTLQIMKYYDIDWLFDVYICADDVTVHKPAPEPVIAALNGLKLSNDEVIMIGDGHSDIISAKAAGVISVLTLWYGDFGVPKESEFVVDSVLELRKKLDDIIFLRN